MSYENPSPSARVASHVYLRSGTTEEGEPECPNPTYNLAEIFDLALTGDDFPNPNVSEVQVILFKVSTDRPRGLRVLSGKKAEHTTEMISGAIRRLLSPELKERFQKLVPENGWGTLADASWVLNRLYELALEYPSSTWEIH